MGCQWVGWLAAIELGIGIGMMLWCNFLKLTSGLSRNSDDSRIVNFVHPIFTVFA
jgi:hypothetical protein